MEGIENRIYMNLNQIIKRLQGAFDSGNSRNYECDRQSLPSSWCTPGHHQTHAEYRAAWITETKSASAVT